LLKPDGIRPFFSGVSRRLVAFLSWRADTGGTSLHTRSDG
jgi:hypothetical protein